jgi:hypothetical protein
MENGEGLDKEAICPISLAVIADPIVISSGIIVDRKSFLNE